MITVDLEFATSAATCGVKAYRLAQIYDTFPVPAGFVITRSAFDHHVKGLPIAEHLAAIDVRNLDSLLRGARAIKTFILEKPLRLDFQEKFAEILQAPVAVRSSSLQEDMPTLSFAGQYDSFLDVTDDLEQYIKLCWASLYSPRAISYRHHNNVAHSNATMAVIIQEMVRGISGVMFTANPNTGDQETLLEFHEQGVVGGSTLPNQVIMTSYQNTKAFQNFPAGAQTLLYRYGEILDRLFGGPMDVEWVFSDPGIHLLQVRPLKVVKGDKRGSKVSALPLLLGAPIGGGLVTGVVQKVISPTEPFKEGRILVVQNTSPEWEPHMRKARALITDKGAQTSHASIVAREMGLHALVGTMDATTHLSDGQTVTLDGADLRIGYVYGGEVKESEKFQGENHG